MVSSRSSKLIHGGLRYLAMGDVALVRETALERGYDLVQGLVHEMDVGRRKRLKKLGFPDVAASTSARRSRSRLSTGRQ